MIKWFLYIVFLMIFVPRYSFAKINTGFQVKFYLFTISLNGPYTWQRDTILTKGSKQHISDEDKKKIKEIAKPKNLPKPEKIGQANQTKSKIKRQRRPDGLERPPEIPRRNNN